MKILAIAFISGILLGVSFTLQDIQKDIADIRLFLGEINTSNWIMACSDINPTENLQRYAQCNDTGN